uniref:HotDog ACOT-type domain-containing protein n=1 Tax=Daucus carota subsp. sativus TaxID=79200 RepID=A0A166D1A7_DAUCS
MKTKKPFFNILFAANSYKSSSSIPKPKQPPITHKHVQYSHPIFWKNSNNKLYSSSTTTTPPHPDSAKPNGDSDEPIDAGSSIRKPISLWPGMYHSPHCSSDDTLTSPLILVTASVDRIALKKPILVERDVTIVGSVTWVGRSSMEIQLLVTQVAKEGSDETDSVVLTANFTFVARHPVTGKSAQINQVKPETENERLLWEEAEERNKRRKEKRREQEKIGAGEVDRLNALLSEGRIFSDMPALADRNSILISDTCHHNSLICQPQQRNIHGRIFGGFLMRRAFELGFATAYSFAGSAPRFVEVDHVDFLKPVDVGNFLRFKSCVLYTELENPEKPLINVEVVAHVTRPEKRVSEVSNKFYFTFTVSTESLGQQIRNVVPATEEEARRVIERMDAETER